MTSTRSAILLYNRVGTCIGRWRRRRWQVYGIYHVRLGDKTITQINN